MANKFEVGKKYTHIFDDNESEYLVAEDLDSNYVLMTWKSGPGHYKTFQESKTSFKHYTEVKTPVKLIIGYNPTIKTTLSYVYIFEEQLEDLKGLHTKFKFKVVEW